MKRTDKEISIRLFGQQLGVLFIGAEPVPVEGIPAILLQVTALQGMDILVTANAFSQLKPGDLAKSEYFKLSNMIKPYLYRRRYCGCPQLAICDDSEYENVYSSLQNSASIILRSTQMLLNEANSLNSEKIKYQTLWNAMHTTGMKIILPGSCKFDDGRFKLSWSQFGQAYGCDAELGSAVLNHLIQKGYLQVENNMTLNLTFEGICEYESYFSSQETREIFVVQPFELPAGDKFESIISECRRLTKLAIEPVWARDHNDKIDERILRKIERCGAILVYVDNSRFNVGFECGYALAKGKQIICIKPRLPKRPSKSAINRFKQPFDISTLNTTEYDDSDWEIAAQRLAARINLAVGDEIPPD